MITERELGALTREGEGLAALEQALDSFIAVAVADSAPKRKVTIVIDLDLSAARILRNALQLARLNGAAIQ